MLWSRLLQTFQCPTVQKAARKGSMYNIGEVTTKKLTVEVF
jgi:hypothetical protein